MNKPPDSQSIPRITMFLHVLYTRRLQECQSWKGCSCPVLVSGECEAVIRTLSRGRLFLITANCVDTQFLQC